jgi:hypothetical protein
VALKGLKKLVAGSALAVALSGGASAALGDAPPAQSRPAVTPQPSRTAAGRQRRIEAGWMAEQLHAERATRRPATDGSE